MTDNEIIKALECCSKAVGCNDCKKIQCSLYRACWKDYRIMGHPIIHYALDLINRQKAEIERLKKGWKADVIETSNIKTEAIKEFAERLKESKYQSSDWSHGEHPFVVEVDDIDNLVKEMVGEDG